MITPQQKKFGQEYINKGDETKAALAAGVDKKFAKKIGKDWIENPDVRKYINDEIEKSAIKAKVTRDWIINEAQKVYNASFKTPDKVAALTLIDKLLTKIDEGSESHNAPQVNILCDGDLTIL